MITLFACLRGGIAFLVATGVLASRLGKSPIAWIGVSTIFSSIGQIITYAMFASSAHEAINGRPQDDSQT